MSTTKHRLAWDARRLVDPHGVPDKSERVREMFSAIVDSYDLNNHVHTLGLDYLWRRATVGLAGAGGDDVVVDVACGTGDLARAFRRCRPRCLIGVDFCGPMLRRAKQKLDCGRKTLNRVILAAGDAMALPLDDQSVDVVSIGFGLRNVADPLRAIAEFARVLRPGGRVAILEFSMPTGTVLARVYGVYFGWLMPLLATIISGDRTGAYRYLPRSVLSFMRGEDLLGALRAAGLQEVRAVPLTFGVAVVYLGIKPGSETIRARGP